MKAELSLQDGYRFEASMRSHRVVLDVSPPSGKDAGPSPKEYFLASVAGCAGMDVAGWLQKHKLKPSSVLIVADAVARDEHPRIFPRMELSFEFQGDGLAGAATQTLIEGVRLSLTKYCGVSAMIRPEFPLEYSVVINGKTEFRGRAEFVI